MYTYNAKILSVYDGDTVTALVDLGFSTSMKIKVRLRGINAPSLTGKEKPLGIASKNRLSDLILNKDVIITTVKDKKEKFGRWLGEIYLNDIKDKSINTLLVEEGFAVPFMV